MIYESVYEMKKDVANALKISGDRVKVTNVDALRAVFATEGSHNDPLPNESQKRRFTALFPRE